MKFNFTIIILVCLTACNQPSNSVPSKSESKVLKDDAIHYPTYEKTIEEIASFKKSNPTKWHSDFFNYINETVPHYWNGTPWDFNGVTQKPKENNIACGYFVTNTLAAYGISLRRVYLAQQVSATMIKTLCTKNSIKRFTKIESVLDYVQQRGNKEIYVVGLDFHTGYIIRDKEKVYFLHSNYIQNKGVMKEVALESSALNASKNFMIGSLSTNTSLFN